MKGPSVTLSWSFMSNSVLPLPVHNQPTLVKFHSIGFFLVKFLMLLK